MAFGAHGDQALNVRDKGAAFLFLPLLRDHADNWLKNNGY